MAGGKGRRSFTREFKARVAGDAMRDVEPVNAVAARHGVGPGIGARLAKAAANQDALIKDLHAEIGELTMERDFFAEHQGDEPRIRL